MRLERLILRDFRNYKRLDVTFPAGIIVLTGQNGAGKSNLLEAIHYLSYLRSFRTTRDREVVEHSAPLAVVEARLYDDQNHPFDARLVLRGGKRHVRLNGSDVTRFQDFIGRLHSQFFFPGDLSLITGDPALRREVLDLELLRLKPQLTRALGQFKKILGERNKTLKLLYPAPGVRHRQPEELQKTLAVFSEQLIAIGTLIIRERRGLTKVLDEAFTPLYASLAPKDGEAINLRYHCQVELSPDETLPERYQQAISQAQANEANLRYTTIGPHRDDLGFLINAKRDLKHYGSQGQQRSAALAFRLALCGLSRQRLNDDPILLLDDALSELDDDRKQRLLGLCQKHQQVFITSASAREAELISPLAKATYRVSNGALEQIK